MVKLDCLRPEHTIRIIAGVEFGNDVGDREWTSEGRIKVGVTFEGFSGVQPYGCKPWEWLGPVTVSLEI